jgi:hypothetical protein
MALTPFVEIRLITLPVYHVFKDKPVGSTSFLIVSPYEEKCG